MTNVVALADVDICQMACSHLGVSQGIQSIDPPDQSTQAQACAFWYPKMRNWLLTVAPWNFADVSLALASDSTTYPGWRYAYQYPADCLQLVAVVTAAGLRYGNAIWSSYWDPLSPIQGSIPKIPTRVVQSTGVIGMKSIMCDLPPTAPVYALYIQCVTDTSLFTSMFSDCLSFYVASRIGGTLRADMKKVQAAAQAGEMMKLQALAQSMNESQQDPERVSPSISVR